MLAIILPFTFITTFLLHGESIHEQLYNFVTNFQEMQPAYFNQKAPWLELQYLLENGAQFIHTELSSNIQHRHTGATMVYCATATDCLQTIALLLAQGADPNIPENLLGNTPLHAAAKKGFLHSVTLLCKNGANPNSMNFERQTPLHCAVLNNQTTIVQALLAEKANPEARDVYGKRPIDYASARGYETIIKLLKS